MKSRNAFHLLKSGDVMPSGWMLEQMRLDLEQGYYPHYDRINHSVDHDLFALQERVSQKTYDGLRCWWSGEHEGYWKDGMIRMAFLAGDEAQKKRALDWLDRIVAAQGDDGYIGIYRDGGEANTRFHHEGENGELWVTSRILQALIAAYDFTGDKKYLTAVRRAVDCVIKEDPGNYFEVEGADGGVAHGIGFFDALWFLVERTGETKYAEYTQKLYRDFCSVSVRDDDLQTGHLLSDTKFRKHGAHVAEGVYVPQFAASVGNDPELAKAADRALEKLRHHLTPSGAMVSDENVSAQPGSGNAGYEYCGIAELIQAFPKLIALTGRADVADMMEIMAFNAAQGSRLPILTGLIYVNHDNIVNAVPKGDNDRPTYSAYHNAAACCTLNGGRVMPYLVEGMWTEGDAFTLHIDSDIRDQTEVAPEQEYYLQHGSLVYALPFPFETYPHKTYVPDTPFVHHHIQASDMTGWDYSLPSTPEFVLETVEGDPLRPYEKPTRALKGSLLDPAGNPVEVTLLPIGATVMRRTTFPAAKAPRVEWH